MRSSEKDVKMARCEKVEKKTKSFYTKPRKLKTSKKTKSPSNQTKASISQNVSCGHDMYNTATTH